MYDTKRVVPRIRYPELPQFDALHYEANEPAVIVGVPQHHDLEVFRFTPEYLESRIGELEFPVLSLDTDFISYERDSIKMTFSEFVRRAFHERSGSRRYYFKVLTQALPPGLDDSAAIDRLSRFLTNPFLKYVWISQGTITVGLHFDPAENLNIQLRGRKRFILYPPGTHGYYPCSMFSQTANISRVFREGPKLDPARFPRFDPSTAREVVLEEGEILYLPAYWWHQVTSLGDVNINVNTFSIPSVRKQLRNWNQAARGHYQLLSRYLAFGDVTKAPRRSKVPAVDQ